MNSRERRVGSTPGLRMNNKIQAEPGKKKEKKKEKYSNFEAVVRTWKSGLRRILCCNHTLLVFVALLPLNPQQDRNRLFLDFEEMNLELQSAPKYTAK